MFDLSYRYNRYHKFTTTVVIVFTILFSLTVLITNMLINSVNKDSMEKLMDQYGSFQFIMHNIDSSDDEYFRSDPDLDSFGYIIHSGKHKLTNKEIWLTLGHIDEDAVRIGNIHLVEGTFPNDENEICLENHIRYAVDPELKTGEQIDIQVGDSVLSFRICGFIKDYRGYWQQSENSTEDTDYPNALILSNVAKANERSKSMVLFYRSIKTVGQFVSKLTSLSRSLTNEKARDLVSNDYVYSSEMEFLSTPIRQYHFLFIQTRRFGV